MTTSRMILFLGLVLMMTSPSWSAPAAAGLFRAEFQGSAQAVTLEMLNEAPGILSADNGLFCFTAGFRPDLKPSTPSLSLGVFAIEFFESRQRPISAGMSLDYLWLVSGTTVWFSDLRFLPENTSHPKPHMIQKMINDAPTFFAQNGNSRMVLGIKNSAGKLLLLGSRM